MQRRRPRTASMSPSERPDGRLVSGAGLLRVSPRMYDFLYRRGAPWEMGPRPELTDLVERGELTPGRSVDLGCGSGANVIYLAEHGFDATGVDFSMVALDKARAAAAERGVLERTHWIRADLTREPPGDLHGAFDLVVDYGTLDDLGERDRSAMAHTMTLLTKPGGRLLFF